MGQQQQYLQYPPASYSNYPQYQTAGPGASVGYQTPSVGFPNGLSYSQPQVVYTDPSITLKDNSVIMGVAPSHQQNQIVQTQPTPVAIPPTQILQQPPVTPVPHHATSQAPLPVETTPTHQTQPGVVINQVPMTPSHVPQTQVLQQSHVIIPPNQQPTTPAHLSSQNPILQQPHINPNPQVIQHPAVTPSTAILDPFAANQVTQTFLVQSEPGDSTKPVDAAHMVNPNLRVVAEQPPPRGGVASTPNIIPVEIPTPTFPTHFSNQYHNTTISTKEPNISSIVDQGQQIDLQVQHQANTDQTPEHVTNPSGVDLSSHLPPPIAQVSLHAPDRLLPPPCAVRKLSAPLLQQCLLQNLSSSSILAIDKDRHSTVSFPIRKQSYKPLPQFSLEREPTAPPYQFGSQSHTKLPSLFPAPTAVQCMTDGDGNVYQIGNLSYMKDCGNMSSNIHRKISNPNIFNITSSGSNSSTNFDSLNSHRHTLSNSSYRPTDTIPTSPIPELKIIDSDGNEQRPPTFLNNYTQTSDCDSSEFTEYSSNSECPGGYNFSKPSCVKSSQSNLQVSSTEPRSMVAGDNQSLQSPSKRNGQRPALQRQLGVIESYTTCPSMDGNPASVTAQCLLSTKYTSNLKV